MFGKRKKIEEHQFCSAVIVAGGASVRMGEDKLFMRLGSSTVIERTMIALQESPYIDEIIIATSGDKIPVIVSLAKQCGISKLKTAISGGENRTASSWAGVKECSECAELIAIHDAARPLVSADIIERAVIAAGERGAAAPAINVKDTVRVARGGRVLKTLERDELFLMQTPQVFKAELIRPALEDAATLGISLTDDCAAAMLMDADIFLVEGSEENMKLTTPADFYAANAILEARGDWS